MDGVLGNGGSIMVGVMGGTLGKVPREGVLRFKAIAIVYECYIGG